jgi:cell fate regulator YaaT (PSP1 superfamily)
MEGSMEPGELLYEIEFKARRREYYANAFSLELREGEWVVVQAERGEDMGSIHKIVERNPDSGPSPTKLKEILRQAIYDDHEKLAKNREMEAQSYNQCKELIRKHGLEMKLVDVEYQFDGNKMTFYFTADERVDFRALVKDLAALYRTRIELRQIGVRDEARRLGGFGICGLQQCCNTFIQEFEPISTQLARDQNLSLNPCLLYEQNHYAESMRKFPEVGSTVHGKLGRAVVEAINVFQQSMTLRYEDGSFEKLTWKDYHLLERKRKGPASTKARE